MALPAIGAAIAGIGIGGTAGAVAGTALGIGGSILNARASRKAAEQQYQNNMAAYDAQQRAELEADRADGWETGSDASHHSGSAAPQGGASSVTKPVPIDLDSVTC